MKKLVHLFLLFYYKGNNCAGNRLSGSKANRNYHNNERYSACWKRAGVK